MGIVPWKKANGQKNTVTRVVLERDAADRVQRFGSEWPCPGGATVRLEPSSRRPMCGPRVRFYSSERHTRAGSDSATLPTHAIATFEPISGI